MQKGQETGQKTINIKETIDRAKDVAKSALNDATNQSASTITEVPDTSKQLASPPEKQYSLKEISKAKGSITNMLKDFNLENATEYSNDINNMSQNQVSQLAYLIKDFLISNDHQKAIINKAQDLFLASLREKENFNRQRLVSLINVTVEIS